MNSEISQHFAELIGAFTGDGWISKGNGGLTLFISGNPKDEKEYYKRIKYLFKKVFSVKAVPRDFPYWGTFGVLICKKDVIASFTNLGFPIGKKSLTVKVPKQIEENTDLFPYFIRDLFDTDGCIYFQKSYNKNASKWQKSCKHKPAVLFTSMSKDLIDSVIAMSKVLGFNFRMKKAVNSKI
jgi:intein/homing endonuclease